MSKSIVKPIGELTAPEQSFLTSMAAINYLYWAGFIKEAEWERVIKRVRKYQDKCQIELTNAHYSLGLVWTSGQMPVYTKSEANEDKV